MTIFEVLDELKVPYIDSGHEHSRPGWIQLDCPFCTKDAQHWRLGYNLAGGYTNCWSCGPLRIGDVLVAQTELPYGRLKKYLDQIERIKLPKEEILPTRGKLLLPRVGPLRRPHKEYLEERGFNCEELTRLWGVCGIGVAARLAWRIFIPIYYQGKLVSWTTRSLQKTGQRYLSAEPHEEILSHKEILYGEDYCRHAIIVVEGPTDVWRIGPGTVATFGTGLRQSQILRIAKYPVRVICMDNEPNAQRKAKELCDTLEMFPGTTHNVILSGKDPCVSPKREIRQLRRLYLS